MMKKAAMDWNKPPLAPFAAGLACPGRHQAPPQGD